MAGIGIKKNLNPMRIGMKVVTGIIGLWVVDMLINIIAPPGSNAGLVDTSNSSAIFYQAWKVLGLEKENGTGVLTIFGIFVALSVFSEVIDINLN